MIWRLKKGEDRRIRAGHPWVYSNELQGSPKGVAPGEWLELHDAGGEFLAWGTGNPHSLIAFRVVSRDPALRTVANAVGARLDSALQHRLRLGMAPWSFRLAFAENDGLPGLIVDRYRLADKRQVFVIQPQTAGAEGFVPFVIQWLQENVSKGSFGADSGGWNDSAVVVRTDAKVRALEGLEVGTAELAHAGWANPDLLEQAEILVKPVAGASGSVVFNVDLWSGQKTGFFLDQAGNIDAVWARRLAWPERSEIRILDLFSYVGQWSTQLARAAIAAGFRVRVLTMDASASALDRARENCERVGAKFEGVKLDIVEKFADWKRPDWARDGFDIVIVDPPALIKNRKSIPQGRHAYTQINAVALTHGRAQSNSLFVSCSCSALFEEAEFLGMLSKAQRKAAPHLEGAVRFIGRGGPASDHPLVLEFPEGHYLKAWIGVACSK